MFRVITFVLALTFTTSLLLAEPTTNSTATSARELYDRVSPSLVVVQYTYDGELGRRELSAAGVVVGDDGLIMTSAAITPTQLPEEQMKDFKIIIPGDEENELDATFQGRDDRTNMAFIKAKESRKWTPIKFEDVPVGIGDEVYSVGVLPKDAGYKTYLMSAMVSSHLRGPVPQVLVTGGGLAAVASPVFNSQGQAIGVVHSQQDQSPILNDPRQPFGSVLSPARLFVPASDFLLSISDPPTAGKPIAMPHIGIASLTGLKKEVAEYFGLKGQPAIQVGDVIPGFPAAKAGIKGGDVIVKVNGQALDRGDEPDETPAIMTRKLLRSKVGDKVTFSVLRGKDQPLQDITVTLEERPRPANRAKRFFAEDLGFTAREVVFEDTYMRKLPAETKGVVVALIKPNSSAQTGKLVNGDLITKLNQTPVESLDQFKQQYESFRKEKPHEAVVMEVLRGVNTQVVRIEPPQ